MSLSIISNFLSHKIVRAADLNNEFNNFYDHRDDLLEGISCTAMTITTLTASLVGNVTGTISNIPGATTGHKVTAKTSDYQITAADCFGLQSLTNEGASETIDFTLPPATPGLHINLIVQSANVLRAFPYAGDIIRLNGVSTEDDNATTEDYIKSSSIGACCILTAINAGEWIAHHVNWKMRSLGKGYIIGGITSWPHSKIQDFDYLTELASTISATITQSLLNSTGVSSNTKGYVLAGSDSGSNSKKIEGLTFATEATFDLGEILDTAVYGNASGFNTTKGYTFGGFSFDFPFYLSIIEDLVFSTETSTALTETLDQGKYYVRGISSSIKTYIMGGGASSKYDTIEAFVFSTELCATISETLSTPKITGGTCWAETVGYYMGGYLAGGSVVNIIEAFTFSSETITTIAATLGTATELNVGINADSKGYSLGGTGNGKEINTLTFSTESIVVLGELLDYTSNQGAGVYYIENE